MTLTGAEPNDAQFIGMAAAKVLLLAINSLGNFLVIQAILKNGRLRTASNYLVLNLAVCDLFSPLLNIPVDILVGRSQGLWHLGVVLCKTVWPTATLLTTSSALTLVAISIDRSRALRHPFVAKLSSAQALVVIATLHALSALSVLPYIIASAVKAGKCDEEWQTTPFTAAQYTMFLFHVQYVVPLLILAVVYTRGARYLRQCTSDLVELKASGKITPGRRRSSVSSLPHCVSSRALRMRSAQNARVVKMFAVVVVVFAVFTLPNNVYWLVRDYFRYRDFPHERMVAFACVMCTYINCLANPIIYTRLSRDYKTCFLKFFRSCGRCCRRGRYSSVSSTLRSVSSTLRSTRTTKSSLRDGRGDRKTPSL